MSGGDRVFEQRLFDILALAAQLSRLDVPLAFVHEVLLDAADKLCKAAYSESCTTASLWEEFATNHYRALHCASCLSDASMFEEQTDFLFASIMSRLDVRHSARSLAGQFCLSMRVGDASAASTLVRTAANLPVSRNSRADADTNDQLLEHNDALAQWNIEFQRPIDVRFYERFLAGHRRVRSSLELAQLRERICNSQSIGDTIAHLVGEWRCKLDECDRHEYWLTQCQKWRTRSTDDVIRVFADTDVAIDARLRMVMLSIKFIAQVLLTVNGAKRVASNSDIFVPLYDVFGNVLLVWTLACYERFYRVLVLQWQSRATNTTREAREVFESTVQKLLSIASNIDSGNEHWNKAAFFDDFLVSFENVLVRIPLDPHDSRALLCAVRTTHRSLRMLNRFFVQVSCAVTSLSTPNAVYTPPVAEFVTVGLSAQQRAVHQISTQTMQLAKLCALLVA